MHAFWAEVRRTLVLAIPMVMGQVGQMALHLIDAAMIGKLGVVPLAAAAFGGNLVGFILVIGYGLVAGVAVGVSNAYGQNDIKRCGDVLRHGWIIVFVYSFVWGLVINSQLDLLYLFSQPVEVVELSEGYVIFLGWSILPSLVYACFKTYSEALNRPWLPFNVLAVGFFLNIFLNWVFIFGKLGCPALGVAGAGLATLLARVFMMVALAAILIRSSRFQLDRAVLWVTGLNWGRFRRLLGIGVPTSFQLLFEAGMFTVSTVMMGWLGASVLAAHHIAMNLTALIFMVPLGMSFAVVIRVGQAAGREDAAAIRRIGFSSIGFVFLLMLGSATFFFATRHYLPLMFVTDNEVVTIAATLLVVAALFQIFDGTQVVTMGSLRGVADVKVPTLVAFIGYWLIGIPLGHYVTFGSDAASPLFSLFHLHPFGMSRGGVGIWIGLLTGLAFTSVILILRFNRTTKLLGANHSPTKQGENA